jgi:hypothetical protein
MEKVSDQLGIKTYGGANELNEFAARLYSDNTKVLTTSSRDGLIQYIYLQI